MKIQVRNSVFETNSSSMHSIAILKPKSARKRNSEYYGWQLTADWLKPGKKVPIVGRYNEEEICFDRYPFRTLTTMYEKMQYAYAVYGPKKFNELSTICEEVTGHALALPVKDGYMFFKTDDLSDDEIEKILESDNPPSDRIIDEGKVYYDFTREMFYTKNTHKECIYNVEQYVSKIVDEGYIDHQSMGMLESFLKKHDITLREFLVNPQYVVIIDGDEYNSWGKLFEAGICQKENFIETGL